MRKPKATPNFILISIAAAAALTLLLHSFTATAQLQTFTAQYGSFNQTYADDFEIIPPASIGRQALRLTPDTPSENNRTLFSRLTSARILLKQRFKLWDEDGNNPLVASFNSSFLFNIYRPQNTTAQGLAFVLAPDLALPRNSNAYFLGLTNSVTDGNASNKFIAAEFDTDRQDFDPDDNHVGIDVNSIESIKTESLMEHNITIAPVGPHGSFHNVWIDYDGVNKVMDVYMEEQAEKDSPTPQKPGSPILSAELNLTDHLNQFSYFGFSASSGSDMQMTRVLRWNLTVHHFSDPEESSSGKWWKVTVGCAAGLGLVAASIVGYLVYKKRTGSLNQNLVGALNTLPGMPREFKFKDLRKATNNFSKHNKLGQGGFGEVFKGILIKESIEIAVKRFSREHIKGQNDFLAELTIINRLRHKHLVKLLGWCYKNGKLLLVYEYMTNGSLDQHLFVGPNKEPLDWSLRLQVLSGVASALHYLHNECEQKVVHRDLKASNILLDSNFNARLGDFGLARALENGKTSYAEVGGVMGTMGYIAPECFLTGKATRQSDVFAFGAVILEVVCGQRPGTSIAGFQFLVDWVWLLHRDGNLLEAVDQKMGDNYVTKEAERMLLLGLVCSHPNPSERPKTEDILQIISGAMSVPRVPPFKPAFVWPAGRPTGMDSSSTYSTTSSYFVSGESEPVGHIESLV